MSATADHEPKTAPILNIAAYKFVALEDLERLRKEIRHECVTLGLRGTILLSPEGINSFLAGKSESVGIFLNWLRKHSEFQDLEVKKSYSDQIPFRRMLVRLKKEIIPCGIEAIKPGEKTSPKLQAQELRKWLDEGRELTLLDVRNKYEFELGTFQGAEQLNLDHFREFKSAVSEMPESTKAKPLVMFCTGGIRCEKAGPVMEDAGFEEVYQLDGGILKYFEECGGAHYDGSCFVFDGRVALDSELKPTGHMLCFNCQAVVTAEDVTSGNFRFGEFCPHCYQPPEEVRESAFRARQKRIQEYAIKQPGSTEYDARRKIHVPGRFRGLKMLDFLSSWQPGIARQKWQDWLEAGDIKAQSGCAVDTEYCVKEGESFMQIMPGTVEPEINPNIVLLHEDDSLVVINKPAPLPVHPSGRYNRNSLLHIVNVAYPNEKLRIAHRLDARTTGVTILCRKYRPAQLVQPQFANQEVDKRYVALIEGLPDWDELVCSEPIAEAVDAIRTERSGLRFEDGIARQKYWCVNATGKDAETHLRVLKRFENRSLVEATPITGRTHQIRVHLAHLGFPILGDDLYSELALDQRSIIQTKQDRQINNDSAVLCLHAAEVTLRHPESNKDVTFAAPRPKWATYM